MQSSATDPHQRWTVRKLIRWAADYLKQRQIDSPRLTAEILLATALASNRLDLYLNYEKPLVDAELQHFKRLLLRRAGREPLAYITGKKEFWSLELEVSPAVLIPRPETECLVEAALEILDRAAHTEPRRILELGTGSGAIVIALAKERPQHFYTATDRSADAIDQAARNARRHDVAGRICFLCADWYSAFATGIKRFDLIVSNPPYIPTGELPRLAPEINKHEPCLALDGTEDGLACVRHIVTHAPGLLRRGGGLLLEIGHDQRDRVLELVQANDQYTDTVFRKDLGGHARVAVVAKK